MKYCLVQDNDSHWYVIPAHMQDAWDKWCQIPSDDEESWDPPDYATAVGGSPSLVEFEGWELRS